MIKEGTEFLDQLKDKVHEQQWEIERLKQFSKNTYETSQELLAEKQARIDKAIELLNNWYVKEQPGKLYMKDMLLEILKGDRDVK